jgi:hypothetical protein
MRIFAEKNKSGLIFRGKLSVFEPFQGFGQDVERLCLKRGGFPGGTFHVIGNEFLESGFGFRDTGKPEIFALRFFIELRNLFHQQPGAGFHVAATAPGVVGDKCEGIFPHEFFQKQTMNAPVIPVGISPVRPRYTVRISGKYLISP